VRRANDFPNSLFLFGTSHVECRAGLTLFWNAADTFSDSHIVQVPEHIDWKKLVDFAMNTRSIEIAGGLGPTVGKIWRIGIMGYNARPQNIAMTLEAFREGLKVSGK